MTRPGLVSSRRANAVGIGAVAFLAVFCLALVAFAGDNALIYYGFFAAGFAFCWVITHESRPAQREAEQGGEREF